LIEPSRRTRGTTAVQLLQLPPEALHALAGGNLAAANAAARSTWHLSGDPLPGYFVDPCVRRVWVRRSEQIRRDPSSVGWISRAVYATELQAVVGRAGFHGPPDEAGMVEVGYSIDPAYRRQGYGRAALEELLRWAGSVPAIRRVRACVRPDNAPSLRLIAQYGFGPIGEQWDDEDGWEIVFEVATEPTGERSRRFGDRRAAQRGHVER